LLDLEVDETYNIVIPLIK